MLFFVSGFVVQFFLFVSCRFQVYDKNFQAIFICFIELILSLFYFLKFSLIIHFCQFTPFQDSIH